ncbi:MAG: bile acid:sodium symporter family protein [Flavobacteriaceae bacterium]|jgi:bile acid:Na+ symporter, BASS family|nr:bile acid:sodium symporter family protein [Flavobacteriaceae bacterium]MDP4673949.1 bile acid:sodium symporter family protein [Flavobacteriaceae bacterium]MDP4754735.1 bile acid:sodium symporter family protein [Flavobacteriaceae bacterium]MDP4794520.1 bile acid:sodium symporter family protein [Flavobacteriaceae bacterium]MDP4885281.1 bile acid:sodium symporter family protein [Flavobacteriaceae bacterium]
MNQSSVLDQAQIHFDEGSLWVMNIALGLVMFGIALNLTARDFKQLWLAPKPIIAGLISQFIALPLVTFFLVTWFNPPAGVGLGMIMVAACPGGNVSNFITQLAKGNTALSISLTALATAVAVLMTPLNFTLYASLWTPGSSFMQNVSVDVWSMAVLVGLLLGFPLGMGLWMRHSQPTRAKKLAIWINRGALLFFLGLIIAALLQNKAQIEAYSGLLFGYVFIHQGLAMATGYGMSRLFGLGVSNQKTLIIETGIQNSGLGLMLIFTFFNGLGSMALIAAFWGIWHLISGLLMGLIMRNTMNHKV